MRHWPLALFFLALPAAPSMAESCSSTSQQAHVTEVYPTADILPENLLRFYIYFSKPMQPTETLSSIYLLDANGTKMDGIFLDNKFNLWSPDKTRLTLLFDPGRVKTGLVAHEAMGRALSAGKDYTLVLDDSLSDASGCPMGSSYQKKFHVIKADFDKPDTKKWHLEAPERHTKDALTVALNGIHDHVSLAYRLRVKNSDGRIVKGRIDLADNEQKWLFVPDQIWENKNYTLTIDPALEDIAGNRITGSFEEPLNTFDAPLNSLNFYPD